MGATYHRERWHRQRASMPTLNENIGRLQTKKEYRIQQKNSNPTRVCILFAHCRRNPLQHGSQAHLLKLEIRTKLPRRRRLWPLK